MGNGQVFDDLDGDFIQIVGCCILNKESMIDIRTLVCGQNMANQPEKYLVIQTYRSPYPDPIKFPETE